ncbi:MAG TPA: Cof-type HAD-IIB family hydrolase [Stellaceae bacterium]|nr:Cof-type HAD-IIB family hydrolase [Stellaceae bacterium]
MIHDANRPLKISLLLSDVDGTLVTKAKVLTPRAIDVVRRLGLAGIAFAIASSRPPKGLASLVEPLNLSTPLTGFNGGMIVDRHQTVLREHPLAPDITRKVLAMLDESGVDTWFFSGNDWLIRKPDGAHVTHEQMTIDYDPIVVTDFEAAIGTATKIVGVSEDYARLADCETLMQATLGHDASIALSQKYYLDITHLLAHKGAAVMSLSELLHIPTTEIATIGDMSNDVRMFERSGFSIAMGNATDAVKAAATVTTLSNEEDGFAEAVERYILPAAAKPIG